MKRALIVTGSGVGTALVALLIAVALGGPSDPVVESPSPLALVPGAVLGAVAIISMVIAGGATFTRDIAVALTTYIISVLACLTGLALVLGGDWPAVIAWGALGAIAAEFVTTRHTRRWRKARARALERIAEKKRASEEYRAETVKQATRRIATDWLTDATSAPESKGRRALLADLDADTAWALARLHRKDVPAEYVAARWHTGQLLDADTLVASYREGGAA